MRVVSSETPMTHARSENLVLALMAITAEGYSLTQRVIDTAMQSDADGVERAVEWWVDQLRDLAELEADGSLSDRLLDADSVIAEARRRTTRG